jgi:putative flippase GtrA
MIAVELGRVARYMAVGLLNTGIGLGTIVILQEIARLDPALANAGGYAVGWTVSFILARGFVFGNTQAWRATAPRYVVAVLSAFAANQMILALAVSTGNRLIIAQIAAVAVYTATLFLACRFWVFREPSSPQLR